MRLRGAGPSGRIRSSFTTTRSTGAATSPRGNNRTSSRQSCARPSGRCGRKRVVVDSRRTESRSGHDRTVRTDGVRPLRTGVRQLSQSPGISTRRLRLCSRWPRVDRFCATPHHRSRQREGRRQAGVAVRLVTLVVMTGTAIHGDRRNLDVAAAVPGAAPPC
jgi:hypothetical protein